MPFPRMANIAFTVYHICICFCSEKNIALNKEKSLFFHINSWLKTALRWTWYWKKPHWYSQWWSIFLNLALPALVWITDNWQSAFAVEKNAKHSRLDKFLIDKNEIREIAVLWNTFGQKDIENLFKTNTQSPKTRKQKQFR